VLGVAGGIWTPAGRDARMGTHRNTRWPLGLQNANFADRHGVCRSWGVMPAWRWMVLNLNRGADRPLFRQQGCGQKFEIRFSTVHGVSRSFNLSCLLVFTHPYCSRKVRQTSRDSCRKKHSGPGFFWAKFALLLQIVNFSGKPGEPPILNNQVQAALPRPDRVSFRKRV